MSCFTYLDAKRLRKKLVQNGAESIPIDIPISYLKTNLPIEWRNIYSWEKIALTRVCLVKYLLLAALEDQYINVWDKPKHFLTSDLKKKLIASAGTFRRNLCKMVEYKVLQSRVEIDSFLTLILFSMVAIAKEVCTTRNFLQPE